MYQKCANEASYESIDCPSEIKQEKNISRKKWRVYQLFYTKYDKVVVLFIFEKTGSICGKKIHAKGKFSLVEHFLYM